jgi:hypothetical protein
MSVIINILETGGGGSPPISDPTEGGLYLPDAYETLPFYAIAEFQFQEITVDPETLEETITLSNPSDVTSDFNFSQYGMTLTKINAYTVRIDGPVVDAFPSQYYQFVLPDLTTPILPFNTEEEFLSLIRYQMPSSVTILLEYAFKVYSSPSNFTVAPVNQWINWLFQSAVNNIDALIIKGLE